jgi:hypothetical protein
VCQHRAHGSGVAINVAERTVRWRLAVRLVMARQGAIEASDYSLGSNWLDLEHIGLRRSAQRWMLRGRCRRISHLTGLRLAGDHLAFHRPPSSPDSRVGRTWGRAPCIPIETARIPDARWGSVPLPASAAVGVDLPFQQKTKLRFR